MEKLLPCNIDAERGVLGSLILDPDALLEVASFLRPADFYRDAHRTLYEAIMRLGEASEPADFVTLCDALERANALSDVGGAGYITSLVDQAPTSANVEYYGRIVERTALLRRLIFAAGQIAATAYDAQDADAALEKAESLILGIRAARPVPGGLRDLSEILAECMSDIDAAYAQGGRMPGVSTGFTELDEMLGGGLQKSDLTIVAARPGMGKSALALNIAHHAASAGNTPVAIFSLEMGAKQLGFRLLAHETGIPTQRMRNAWLGDEDWQHLVRARDHLDTLPISIDDTSGSPLSFIRNELRKRQNATGRAVGLVIVDYLQLMEPPTDSASDERARRATSNRVQEIDKIVYGLKSLAKDFAVPVLALAQLSRAVESRQVKIPQLSDLRESGGIEQAADNILFIYRDDYYAGKDEQGRSKSATPGIADILIAKQRNSDIGEIKLYWSGKQTRFFNSKEEYERAYTV